MTTLWFIRILILSGAFYLHWLFGLLLSIGLVSHMMSKAATYNKRYNLNIVKKPWIFF